MKWFVYQLNRLQHKGLKFEEMIDVSPYIKMGKTIRSISEVSIKGRVDFAYEKYVFHLQIDGKMILACSRTLEDVEFSFHIETTEAFLLYEETDSEDHVIQEDLVDLMPIVAELILLEVPMQVFSDKPMLSEGKGWNVLNEDEIVKKIDPRLAKLNQFFENKDE